MKLEQLIIGILTVSLIMITGSVMIGSMINEYKLTPTENDIAMFNGSTNESRTGEGTATKVYDSVSSMSDLVSDLEGKTKTTPGQSTATGFDVLFQSGFTAISLITRTFDNLKVLINVVSFQLGVASYVGVIIFLMITVSVIFTLLYIIFRFQPQR